jgi:hypothetical protein
MNRNTTERTLVYMSQKYYKRQALHESYSYNVPLQVFGIFIGLNYDRSTVFRLTSNQLRNV